MNLTGQTIRQREPREKDRKYLDSFRDTTCESCGAADETVVGAHFSFGNFARGMKADDYFTAGLCFKCHAISDQGSFKERTAIWLKVLKKLMRDRYRAWQGAAL